MNHNVCIMLVLASALAANTYSSEIIITPGQTDQQKKDSANGSSDIMLNTALVIGLLTVVSYMFQGTGAIAGYVATKFGATMPQALGIAAIITPTAWSAPDYFIKPNSHRRKELPKSVHHMILAYMATMGTLGAYMTLKK